MTSACLPFADLEIDGLPYRPLIAPRIGIRDVGIPVSGPALLIDKQHLPRWQYFFIPQMHTPSTVVQNRHAAWAVNR